MPANPNWAPALTELGVGLFDYAGLYPPAALPIPEAVEEYVRLLDSPQAAFVGPFVVDAHRLEAVARTHASIRPGRRIPVSLLAGTRRPLQQDIDVARTLLSDGQFTAGSNTRSEVTPFEITQIETVWPTTAEEPQGQLAHVLAAVAPLSPLCVFLEVPPDAPDLAALARVAGDAASGDRLKDTEPPLTALKIRCGGPSPTDVPSVADVARFLRTCALHAAPFKATAGLHHPVRAYHDEFGGFQHGFLNVFLAALLLRTDTRRDPATIDALLSETDADAFVIEPDAIGWRDLRLDLDEVRGGRRGFALSIGSCSIAEPVADLRALGWLE